MGKQRKDYLNKRQKACQLSFDDWLEYYRVEMPDIDWDSDKREVLGRLQMLFSSAGKLRAKYDAETLNKLLWSLIGESGFMQVLFDERLEIASRVDCIKSIELTYKELFMPECSPILSNGLKETPEGTSALNSICYMWWDIFPLPHGENQNPRITEAIFELLETLLSYEHKAIQESALHGLGHMAAYYPDRIQSIIDSFLRSSKSASAGLRTYAESAKCGCVL